MPAVVSTQKYDIILNIKFADSIAVETGGHVLLHRRPKHQMTGPNRSEKARAKLIVGTLIGNTAEWYDFYIYGTAAALVFSRQFFPNVSPLTGTLLAFATFGVGFIARPLGGVVFGHIGDRFGRKGALVATLLVMGICTFLVGVVPNFESFGYAAPCILVVLRLLQGVAVGGEWSGSVLMAGEHAPDAKRGLYVALPQIGTAAGLLLGNAAFLCVRYLMTEQAFLDWGWRVPFLLSSVLVVVGFVIRRSVEESPVFVKMQALGQTLRNPLSHVIKTSPRTLLLAGGVFVLNNTAFFVSSTFGLNFAVKHGVPSAVGLSAVMIGSLLSCFGIVWFAHLSDRFGRRPVLVSLYSVWLLWAFAFFPLLSSGKLALIYLAFIVAVFLTSATGPLSSFIPEQFESNVRYTGMSLSIQGASVLGGGLGPLLVTLLEAKLGIFSASCYVFVIALVSIGCVLSLPETRAKSLLDAATEASPAIRNESARRQVSSL